LIYKFFKMAIANLLRYGTRTALTSVGLALAIAVVLFVNVISLSFESGAAQVYRYLQMVQAGVANVWVTPTTGINLDSSTGFFTTEGGTLPESLADQILKSGPGIKVVVAALPGITTTRPVTLYGRSDRQTAAINQAAKHQLNLNGNDTQLNQVPVQFDLTESLPEIGAGGLIELPLATAQKILDLPAVVHWVMLKSPNVVEFRDTIAQQQNILVTTDPTVKVQTGPAQTGQAQTGQAQAGLPDQRGIAYLLRDRLGRGDLVTFDVKLAAIYFNQASSTLLGWLAKITLGLGFVLMLSAALLSLEERRHEFGILTAVGVSSDVLYLFLLESLILFIGATLLGIGIGILLLQILVPTLFNWSIILKSVVLVICYLPPMVIFGSLIPAQQLLRKSPLELLRTATA
jgi:putative ABC transport system permease protein